MSIDGCVCVGCGDIRDKDEMTYCAGEGCVKMLCSECYAEKVRHLTGDQEFEIEDPYEYINTHDIECDYCRGTTLSEEELIEHALLLLGISREDLEMSCRTAKTIS